ncbi:HAD family hydrolase [Pseudovibrio ascidiaceicola]|uniref:HAD family hydrolase n=1 Tax=Pseudovibrio ascidiaceicola TaxID=285279 RepID=UPI003D36FB0C
MKNVVSLDIDQTIIDFEAMLERSLSKVSRKMFCEYGISVSKHQLQSERQTVLREFQSACVDMLKIRQISFERILERHNASKQFAASLIEIFATDRFSNVCFMPGALDFLRKASQAHNIVAITNGNSDPRLLGFGEFFEHVVLGEKFPFKKPDVRIFSEALSHMNAGDPKHAVHIGDSLENDVLGANESGMVSVWYNPHRYENKTNISPRFEVRDFEELYTILQKIKR